MADTKRLKCFNCHRRRPVVLDDWLAQKSVARDKGARWLEVACGWCFEAMIADTDGHDTQDMTTAEILAELLIPPERRRWRWIQRYEVMTDVGTDNGSNRGA